MKVFVDMEKLKAPNSGLGVFCKELGAAFMRQAKTVSFSFFVPKEMFGFFGTKTNYIIQSIHHKIFSPHEEFDVWHCTHQDSVYFPGNRNTKVLLTIHDLNYLHKYTGIKRKLKQYRLQKRIERADALSYISEYTKQQVHQNFDIQHKPEFVVYNGLSIITISEKPALVEEAEKFFFTIGVINPKKNVHVLPQLLAAYPGHKLIIAGKCDSVYEKKIIDEAVKNQVAERVVFLGEVKDTEKNWLYQHCSAFFFPSLAEGFGLPVVEAMHFGVPVFLSNKTALPEIGGDVCFYWSSFEKKEMLETLNAGLLLFHESPEHKTRMQERATQFNWDFAATQYLNIYKQLAK